MGSFLENIHFLKPSNIICFGNLINNEYNKIKNSECKDFLSKFEIVKNVQDNSNYDLE
jgi:hypothetical protein